MAKRALLVAAIGVSAVTHVACSNERPIGNAMGLPPCDAADPSCYSFVPDAGPDAQRDVAPNDANDAGPDVDAIPSDASSDVDAD